MLRVFALAILVSCGPAKIGPAPQGDPDVELLEPGLHTRAIGVRTYLVYVPEGYQEDTSAPVIFMLHGGFGSGQQTMDMSRFNAVADEHGIITVYPDGSGLVKTWNAGTCCGFAKRNEVDDVGFHAAMLAALEQVLSIDPARVFAAGMSNGAMMAYRLACELPAIRGAAGVAGSHEFLPCEPGQPKAILHFHGTDDTHVPWEGGVGDNSFANVDFTSVAGTVAGWRARNACTTEKRETYRQGEVVCERYEACAAGGFVELCRVEAGGHTWPGGKSLPALGKTTTDINASAYLAVVLLGKD